MLQPQRSLVEEEAGPPKATVNSSILGEAAMQQKIGDRVIDGEVEGEIVNTYDTDAGPVVVVRWDKDPEFGVHLGFDDPHCEDLSPSHFYPKGKNCWGVRAE
jgi:hypothetical protein